MDFKHQLQQYADWANDALRRFLAPLPFAEGELAAAMRYAALMGGKRLRPFLVYATGTLFGCPREVLDAPAAAVECIHAYSLVHDDLPAMDDDDLRRGLPTCHVKYGEAHAILAGDALQTQAFSILADSPMPGVASHHRLMMISELAQASGIAGMCGGQALDLEGEGKPGELASLERIHRHKTGALIRAAVRLGALCAGEPGIQALPALDRYAQNIGLAFQVQDDILDVVGDTSILGKRQGADMQLGKSTYPALLGLEPARDKAQALCQNALDALQPLQMAGFETTVLNDLAHYIIQRDN